MRNLKNVCSRSGRGETRGAEDVVVDRVNVDVTPPEGGAEDVDDGNGGEDEGPGLVGGVEEDAEERDAEDTGERGARVSSGEDQTCVLGGDI